MTPYQAFLVRKTHDQTCYGFEPKPLPAWLFPFQQSLVAWSLQKGRAALFADCGLGKTPMQLVWAQQVIERTNKPVLILTPLAVGQQTVAEGEKFSIPCVRSRDGRIPSDARIVVTNYEKRHLFSPDDFSGVVCDESSILKHFAGATQAAVTRFLLKMPSRLLCTATAAPNDYIELGTSSEALGELGYSDMLARFFRQSDNKSHRMEQIKQQREERKGRHFGKLAFRVAQQIGQWRLKGHAVTPFWRWVASWARACRRPSDLGFDDTRFVLPRLEEIEHTVKAHTLPDGMLFDLPAFGLQEEREERRRTLRDRCQYVAQLVDHAKPAVVWCHLNDEGDLLAKLIPDARQVRGSDSDEAREATYQAFASGELRVLVIKPKIGAWGLNWQHCAHVVTFATHSYEQYYQAIRRCWRFGQTQPVRVDIVSTEGEQRVKENMQRKAQAADVMFSELMAHMQDAVGIARETVTSSPVEIPSWL